MAATVLTAFNDNALITYLATLVPDLDDVAQARGRGGAVTGGGLTVIANAPEPGGAGAARPLLRQTRYHRSGLAAGAIGPTLVAAIVLHVL